jgi:hypothetical protein
MADENSYRDIKLIIKFVWNPLFLTQVYVKFTQVCVKHKKRRSGGGGGCGVLFVWKRKRRSGGGGGGCCVKSDLGGGVVGRMGGGVVGRLSFYR